MPGGSRVPGPPLLGLWPQTLPSFYSEGVRPEAQEKGAVHGLKRFGFFMFLGYRRRSPLVSFMFMGFLYVYGVRCHAGPMPRGLS